MNDSKITLNTRTGFSSLKNDFVQSESISVSAKGTALFLQSLPAGWKIHPLWIKKKLGFGERVWLRVAEELIDFGYLQYYKGGPSGGSYYVFDAWNHKDNFIESENDKMSTPTKCGSRKMSLLNNKLTNNKQTKIKNNKQGAPVDNSEDQSLPKSSVVVFLEKELMQFGLNIFDRDKIIREHEADKIKKAIEHTNLKPRRNPAGFLVCALQKGWTQEDIKTSKTTEHEVILKQTKTQLDKFGENLKRASSQESRKAGMQALNKLKGRLING